MDPAALLARCAPVPKAKNLARLKPLPSSRAIRFARVEQPVQVHDEIAHMGVVHRAVGGVLPGVVGLGIVGIDADDVELLEVAELDLVERCQLAPEHKMKPLPLAGFSPRHAHSCRSHRNLATSENRPRLCRIEGYRSTRFVRSMMSGWSFGPLATRLGRRGEGEL